MTHDKIKELLPLYIDKGLSPEEEDLVQEHLNNCPECQKELKEYQENHLFLSRLKEFTVPEGFKESILKKVGEGMKEKSTSPFGTKLKASLSCL